MSVGDDEVINNVRNSFLGYEALLEEHIFYPWSTGTRKYAFESRSRNPADPFNCMLNYSYGILYSNVEKACIIAGLDPYIGIMHTDNYNKKALVYDIVEMYRDIWMK